MSNEWITDRLPTEQDACKDADSLLYECVILLGYDYKLYRKWYNVKSGEAWQRIETASTAMPCAVTIANGSRWEASYSRQYQCWVLDQKPGGGFRILGALDINNDQHRKAAERIAAVYGEVMP